MKNTNASRKLAVALMSDPSGRHWGYDTSKKSGLRSGALYPLLHRMLDQGWLTDGWEDAPTATTGKRSAPPRRYYELTELGRRELGALASPAAVPTKFRAQQA